MALPKVGMLAMVEGMSQYMRDVGIMEKSYLSLEKGAQSLEKKTEALGKKWDAVGKTFSKAGTIMLGAGGAAAAGILALATSAGTIPGITRAFEMMSKESGLSLEQLRKASMGTVSDLELMRLSNVALTGAGEQLGVEFGQNLPKLLNIAQAAARATGQSSEFMFQSLVTGIKRTSPMLIDNTGLQLKLGEANKALADQLGVTTEQLSGEQKQIAIFNATLQAGQKMVDQFGGGQTTAAEQTQAFTTRLKNLKDELSVELLPAFTTAMDVVGKAVGKFADLAIPLKTTIAHFAVLGTGVLLVGGIVAKLVGFVGPAIVIVGKLGTVAISTAQTLALMAMEAGSLGAALRALAVTAGPLVLAGALVAAIVAIHQMEEAHKKEAAAIVEASDTYDHYISRMRGAKLESYALSESLYEQVKAIQATGQAIDVAGLQDALADLEDAFAGARARGGSLNLRELIDGMGELELMVAADVQQMQQLGKSMGMTSTVALKFAQNVSELAIAERNQRTEAEEVLRIETQRVQIYQRLSQATKQLATDEQDLAGNTEIVAKMAADVTKKFQDLAHKAGLTTKEFKELKDETGYTNEEVVAMGQDLEITAKEFDDLAAETGYSREQLEYWHQELGQGETFLRSYIKGLDDAQAQMVALSGTIAGGIGDLRDLNDEVRGIGKDYRRAMGGISAGIGTEIDKINEKYDEMHPDPTTVQERLGMDADAWDEYALRLDATLDGVTTGQEQGWVDSMAAMTVNSDEYRQREGEAQDAWLARLRGSFYEMGLPPEFYDTESGKYQAHLAEIDALRQGEIQKQRDAAAASAAIEQQKRDAALAAAQQKKEDLVLATSLQMAEELGLLQTWANDTMGVMAPAFDSADEVLQHLEAGTLELTPELEALVGAMQTGLLGTLESTGVAAEETAGKLSDLFTESEDQAAGMLTDFEAIQTAAENATAAMGDFTKPPEEEKTFLDYIMEQLLPFEEGVGTTMDNVGIKAGETTDSVKYGWLDEAEGALPLIQQGLANIELGAVDTTFPNIETAGKTAAANVKTAWTNFITAMIKPDEGQFDKLQKDWIDTVAAMETKFINSIKAMKKKMNALVEEIRAAIRACRTLGQMECGVGGGGGGEESTLPLGWEWYNDEQGRRLSRPIGSLQPGGMAWAGHTYLTGERGPELFTPGISGRVHPADVTVPALAVTGLGNVTTRSNSRTINNELNLTVRTMAPASTVMHDFEMMRALVGG